MKYARWIGTAFVIAVTLIAAVQVVSWLGIAEQRRPCDFDCPLAILGTSLTDQPIALDGQSLHQFTLTGVATPQRNCGIATIEAEFNRFLSNKETREYVGTGSTSIQNLGSGDRWDFAIEITSPLLDPQGDFEYFIEWSAFRCSRQ